MVVEFSDGSLYENVGQLQWVFLRCLGILTPLLLQAPQSNRIPISRRIILVFGFCMAVSG